MNVLVIGGGGREHAIIYKLKQNKTIKNIYAAPGNGGISKLATCINIKADEIEKLKDFVKENNIDLTVVGPDDPLAMGIVDEFKDYRIFGPSKQAAMLEASKVFAKDIMKKYNIPTAKYEVFKNPTEALNYLENTLYPSVIKADGLALGKGVIIVNSFEEAEDAVKQIMVDKVFKEAGSRIVVEEFLIGEEVSVLAFCDGENLVCMPPVQDHKRALDNDGGLNTGGMGTFTPSAIYTDDIKNYCIENIFKPTVNALKSEGIIYKGVLYFGLILTKDGPKVLEYNARFGDPETQVLMPLLKTDLLDIINAVIDGRLDSLNVEWEDSCAVCVVAASGGYPGKYVTGYEITGLPDGEIIFHAGTRLEDDKVLTSGGRVLGAVAKDKSFEKAIEKAYKIIDKIDFKDMHFRKDIGRK